MAEEPLEAQRAVAEEAAPVAATERLEGGAAVPVG